MGQVSRISNVSFAPMLIPGRIAQILSGFISFGVLHIKDDHLAPWQWYMLITGIITLGVAVAYWSVPRGFLYLTTLWTSEVPTLYL